MQEDSQGKVDAVATIPALGELAQELINQNAENVPKNKVKEIVLDYMSGRGEALLEAGHMQLKGVLRWAFANQETFYTNGINGLQKILDDRADEIRQAKGLKYNEVVARLYSAVDKNSPEFQAAMEAFRKYHGWYGERDFKMMFELVVDEDEEAHLTDPEIV